MSWSINEGEGGKIIKRDIGEEEQSYGTVRTYFTSCEKEVYI